MSLQEYLGEQLQFWHQTLDQAVSLTPADALHRAAGSKTNTIAAIYAHVTLVEDFIVNARLRDGASLWDAGGWGERTGVASPGSPPLMTREWALDVRLDYAAFHPYAQSVHNATGSYVAGLSDEDLERASMGLFRESTTGRILMAGVYAHLLGHAGEIAALKGVFGQQGLPF